jgi:hypothetical protein
MRKDILYMPKKNYPHWVKASDDSFNKTLKLIIIILYAYAVFQIAKELLS